MNNCRCKPIPSVWAFFLFFSLISGLVFASPDKYDLTRLSLRFSPEFSSSVNRSLNGKIAVPTGNAEFDRILNEFGVTELRPIFTFDKKSLANPNFHRIGLDRDYLVQYGITSKIPTDVVSARMIASRFAHVSGIERAELPPIRFSCMLPDDWSTAGTLWGLDSMHCPAAWDSARGNDEILVSVIDTGVEYSHEDLQDNLWFNPAEDIDQDGRMTEADLNGVDNDSNGYVDDVIGWNFAAGSNNVAGSNPHGTHTSGIIAARTNNGFGVASASFNVKLIAVQVGFANYPDTNIARGIQYAVNSGVRIISMSFGSDAELPQFFQDAIDFAQAHDCLLFAAAGNNGDTVMMYPAAATGVIAVAALAAGDVVADFSSYGNWIGLSAPGANIYSTFTNNTYEAHDGTSMACPNAAAVAALIWSRNPSMMNSDVESLLYSTAINLDSYNPTFVGQMGAGLPDAQAAIALTPARSIELLSHNNPDTIWAQNTSLIRWNASSTIPFVRIEINRNYPYTNWETLANNVNNNGVYSWLVTGQPSSHVRLRIVDPNDTTQSDRSDENFTINSPLLRLRTQNDGDTIYFNQIDTIRWDAYAITYINIELNLHYPVGQWITIATNVPADQGRYLWTIGRFDTDSARIRIVNSNSEMFADTSDCNFSIKFPSMVFSNQSVPDTFWVRIPKTINWISYGMRGNVDLLINRNFPDGPWQTLVSDIQNVGYYRWNVTGPVANNVRFKLIWRTDTTVTAVSQRDFIVMTPVYQLISPNGGEYWGVGQRQVIRWNSNRAGTIRIQMDRLFPSNQWQEIVSSVVDSGSAFWTVTIPMTGHARLRLLPVETSLVGDTSNADFSIGVNDVEETERALPKSYSLSAPYPNPFNSTTEIKFALPRSDHVSIEIFDVMGRKVATLVNGQFEVGYHSTTWSGVSDRDRKATGIYFVKMNTSKYSNMQKVILLK